MAPSKSLLNFPSGDDGKVTNQPPGQTKPIPAATKTGRAPFAIPGESTECETWYSIWGTLNSTNVPLIVLHGGPGVQHNYLLPIAHVASEHRAVVFYDQIGCGNSTHLQHKGRDASFWNVELFVAELENLIKHLGIEQYDLLGHSWGGMLAADFVIRKQPKTLRKLIISSSPTSIASFEDVANELRALLPQDIQDGLLKLEAEGKDESHEYEELSAEYYARFVCRVSPMPQEMVDSDQGMKKDNTVSITMMGPSEFRNTGSLKTWNITDQVHKINVPTLLLNGKYDEAQDVTIQPFFDRISGPVKWVHFGESSHCAQLEETDAYVLTVSSWLDLP